MTTRRELILAVTDLEPLDAEAAAALPRLPALEALLARAERSAARGDWRRWALERIGLEPAPGDLPIGTTFAAAAGLDVERASWLLATPVHLEVTLTHVRLHSAGPVPLAAEQARALAARATAELGDEGFELRAVGERLLARFAPVLDVATYDPAPRAGHEIGAHLPDGPDGGRVRRRMTELQMWLHGRGFGPSAGASAAPNALWLWGAGREFPRGAARWPTLDSDDAWLHALRARASGPTDAPGATLATRRLGSLAGDEHALARADREWFAPLARALAAGEYERVQLYFAGAAFELRPAQRWRFWRRPRPWWESAA